MPDIDAWLGTSFPLSSWLDVSTAVDVTLIIAEKSTSITITPVDGRTVAAQTVRIETLGDYAQRESSGITQTSTMRVGIIGAASVDLKRGDRFVVSGTMFEIVQIEPGWVDRMLAIAEARK